MITLDYVTHPQITYIKTVNIRTANWTTPLNLIKVNDLPTCRNISARLINYPIRETVQRVTVRLVFLYDLYSPPALRACSDSCAWPTASARRLRAEAKITGTGVPDHIRTPYRFISLITACTEWVSRMGNTPGIIKLIACIILMYLIKYL